MQIAVCDDNHLICAEIEKIISEYAKANNFKVNIEVFYSGEGFLNYVETEHNFDLIFLDIEMRGVTGVGVGTVIRNKFKDHISKIIFISGASGYEMELFNLQPLNFLKKPVNKRQICSCIDLAREILGVSTNYFEYKFRHEIKKVPYKEIIYFESVLRKVAIKTAQSSDEIYGSLEKIRQTLPKIFVAPHRAYAVNFAHVITIQPSQLIMSNGDAVPISQRNLKNIRAMQLEMEMEKRNARL